ncbi:MAG: hypothetical protein M3680_36515 [Myxococcota bacterium]|nr:hypothetical protein [Myxococcota bacterium]
MSTLPEALRRSPRPRPRVYGSLARVYAVVGVLVAIAAGQAVGVIHYLRADVAAGPPTGQAEVIGAEVKRGGRGHESGEVTFRHGDVTARCLVPVAEVAELRAGQPLPYWRDGNRSLLEPCARYAQRDAPRLVRIFSMLGALALVGAAIAGYRGRRLHTILTRGQGAVGIVRTIQSHDRGSWKLALELEIAGPLAITGKVVVRRRIVERLGGGRAPIPGDTAYVVYDPTQPKRFALWSFEPRAAGEAAEP